MFVHIFLYRFKTIIRAKGLMFWLLIFPLILSTLFKFAFGNLLSQESFGKIDIAIVDNNEFKADKTFQQVISSVSDENNESSLFNCTYVDKATADSMLNEGKIKGYIIMTPEIKLTVSGSGFEQSVIKSFLDTYKQSSKTIINIIERNPGAIAQGLLSELSNQKDYLTPLSPNSSPPDNTLIYFYSIIAMICLYSAFSGVKEVTDTQANCSVNAARINIAPTHKLKSFLAGILAAFLVQAIVLAVLFMYMIYILGVNFGTDILYIALTCIVGTLCGLFFGAFMGAVLKTSADVKESTCVAITMFMCVLAGMMGSNIKYYAEEYVPVLKYVNPVRIITDALYSLYYFETYTRFYIDLINLSIIALIFAALSFLLLRRQRYASI